MTEPTFYTPLFGLCYGGNGCMKSAVEGTSMCPEHTEGKVHEKLSEEHTELQRVERQIEQNIKSDDVSLQIQGGVQLMAYSQNYVGTCSCGKKGTMFVKCTFCESYFMKH